MQEGPSSVQRPELRLSFAALLHPDIYAVTVETGTAILLRRPRTNTCANLIHLLWCNHHIPLKLNVAVSAMGTRLE